MNRTMMHGSTNIKSKSSLFESAV